MNNVNVVYTPWSNLKKTADMDVGQIGFHRQKDVSVDATTGAGPGSSLTVVFLRVLHWVRKAQDLPLLGERKKAKYFPLTSLTGKNCDRREESE